MLVCFLRDRNNHNFYGAGQRYMMGIGIRICVKCYREHSGYYIYVDCGMLSCIQYIRSARESETALKYSAVIEYTLIPKTRSQHQLSVICNSDLSIRSTPKSMTSVLIRSGCYFDSIDFRQLLFSSFV